MQHWFPLLAAILVSLACSYRRAGLRTWSALTAVAIVAAGVVADSIGWRRPPPCWYSPSSRCR